MVFVGAENNGSSVTHVKLLWNLAHETPLARLLPNAAHPPLVLSIRAIRPVSPSEAMLYACFESFTFLGTSVGRPAASR
jgi:hypothetical protein